MKIYLDSKDLINVIEHSNPCSSDDLSRILLKKNHKIVFSNVTILEISEPLLHKKAKTNVMKVLTKLKNFPHIFINNTMIIRLELIESINAFKNKREFNNIYPYVKRFDESIEIYGRPPTRLFLNYSMPETVWHLYQEGALKGYDEYANKMRHVFATERSLKKKPNLKINFINTIKKNLSLYKLILSSHLVEFLSRWIYEKPTRCPSIRLYYEVFHKIVNNIGYIPKNSDIEDLIHIQCLPYVDLMTVDRQFYAYVSQAGKSLNINYQSKIRKSINEILDCI